MTYQLSSTQSDLWKEGWWSAWRIEEDVLADLDRQRIDAPVVVTFDDGTVAFGVTAQGVRV